MNNIYSTPIPEAASGTISTVNGAVASVGIMIWIIIIIAIVICIVLAIVKPWKRK